MRSKQDDTSHPGAILLDQIINKNDLTMTKAAKLLGVSRAQLYYVTGGRCDITPDMCQRIATVFNEDAEKWAIMQAKHSVKLAQPEIQALNLKPYIPL